MRGVLCCNSVASYVAC